MNNLSTLLTILEKKANPVDIRDATFAPQDKFVLDDSRYLIARCTRRAGKSTGLGLRFFRTMMKHPGCFCPYVALTRESAKNIMWGVLQEQNEMFKLGAKFTESNLTITLPNNSRLQLFGADMKNFIRRLKGIKTPGAAIDELQDFGAHVETLIDDVLGPAIVDYTDGWIALTGTPGPVPSGYFYDVTEKMKGGYSIHKWSLFDNPYLPNPKKFVEDLKKRKGWNDQHPTLRREYFNEWILDLDILVFQYDSIRNHFDQVPSFNHGWHYVIGVDIGFNDADAIAVIGWNDQLKEVYLVEEFIKAQQGVTELADTLERFIKKYNPDKVVMDVGGLGKKIAEELRRRRNLPILAAEKTRKIEFIEILNDALRTKKFFAKKDSMFASDSQRVKWNYEKSTPDKRVVSDSFHSDICDAVLYAFKEALHFLYREEIKPIRPGSTEWMDQQVNETVEMLEESLFKEKEVEGILEDPLELSFD